MTPCGQAYDVCGVCGGDGASCRPPGCDGLYKGTKYDKCGECGGTGLTCAHVGCDGNKADPFGRILEYDACGVCGGQGNTCIGTPIDRDIKEKMQASFDLKNTPLPSTISEMQSMKAQLHDDMVMALTKGTKAIIPPDDLRIDNLNVDPESKLPQVTFTIFRSFNSEHPSPHQLYLNLQEQFAAGPSTKLRRKVLGYIFEGVITKHVDPSSLVIEAALDCDGRPVTDKAILANGSFKQCTHDGQPLPGVTFAPLSKAPVPTTFAPIASVETRPPTMAPEEEVGDTPAPVGDTVESTPAPAPESFAPIASLATRLPTQAVQPTPLPSALPRSVETGAPISSTPPVPPSIPQTPAPKILTPVSPTARGAAAATRISLASLLVALTSVMFSIMRSA